MPGARARGLDLHQRHEAVHLRLVGREPREDAAEPKRLLEQRGPHPVVARRRGVALVEDEVDHLEHRGQPRAQLVARRQLEGHPRRGERALRAHDALRDRRLRHQERARDLVGA